MATPRVVEGFVSFLRNPSISRDALAIGSFWAVASLIALSLIGDLPEGGKLFLIYGSWIAVFLITFLHAYNSMYTITKLTQLYFVAALVWCLEFILGPYVFTREPGVLIFFVFLTAAAGIVVITPWIAAICLAFLARALRARRGF